MTFRMAAFVYMLKVFFYFKPSVVYDVKFHNVNKSYKYNIAKWVVSIRAAALVQCVNSRATNNWASIMELVDFAPTTGGAGIPISLKQINLDYA